MNTNHKRLLAGLLLCLTYAAQAPAAPRIAVTQPALHSLVVSLMQGVAKPELILQRTQAGDQSLDPFQTGQLLTADLVIWVGSGLEPGVAQAMERFPSIGMHAATLSNTLPLLLTKDFEGVADQRQRSRDLHFWNDPRLAIMAVKQITPKLVRVDPDHTELYLDNEIVLLKRLKQTQSDIAQQFAALPTLPEGFATGFDQYFAHRFLPVTPATSAEGSTRKASLKEQPFCRLSEMSGLPIGKEYYFESMMSQARDVLSCAGRLNHRHQMADRKPLPPAAG